MILNKLLNKYLFIYLIVLSNSSFVNAQVNVSIPDTTVVTGDTILIPIRATLAPYAGMRTIDSGI